MADDKDHDPVNNAATRKPIPEDEAKPKDTGKENADIDPGRIRDNKKWE